MDALDLLRGEGAVEAGQLVEEAHIIQADQDSMLLAAPRELLVPAGDAARGSGGDVKRVYACGVAGVVVLPCERDGRGFWGV